jgi:hypothetical protein
MTPEQYNQLWNAGAAFTTTKVDVFDVTVNVNPGRRRLGLISHAKLVAVLQASPDFHVEPVEFARFEALDDHIFKSRTGELFETLEFIDADLTEFLDASTQEHLSAFVDLLIPDRRQRPQRQQPSRPGQERPNLNGEVRN